jgi:hypothetical protein
MSWKLLSFSILITLVYDDGWVAWAVDVEIPVDLDCIAYDVCAQDVDGLETSRPFNSTVSIYCLK